MDVMTSNSTAIADKNDAPALGPKSDAVMGQILEEAANRKWRCSSKTNAILLYKFLCICISVKEAGVLNLVQNREVI